MGPVGLFAKAGAMKWDLEGTGGFSDSGTDPAYGIGAKFSLLSFQIRAEYEVLHRVEDHQAREYCADEQPTPVAAQKDSQLTKWQKYPRIS